MVLLFYLTACRCSAIREIASTQFALLPDGFLLWRLWVGFAQYVREVLFQI